MAKEMLMVPTSDYNNLVNYYKGRLTESALLNKAGRLAAERHVALNSPHLNKSVAVTMSKQGEREIHKLTKRLRTGGVSVSSRGVVNGNDAVDADDDDDEDDLLKSPLESKLDKIIRNTRKKKRKSPNVGKPIEAIKKKQTMTPQPSKIPTLLGVQKTTLKKPKHRGGWKKALKRGALKGVAQHWGVSVSEGDTAKTPKKRKTTPRAVKALRPAPGWEDFTEGYKSKRYPLTDDYAGSSEATEPYDGETDDEEDDDE